MQSRTVNKKKSFISNHKMSKAVDKTQQSSKRQEIRQVTEFPVARAGQDRSSAFSEDRDNKEETGKISRDRAQRN